MITKITSKQAFELTQIFSHEQLILQWAAQFKRQLEILEIRKHAVLGAYNLPLTSSFKLDENTNEIHTKGDDTK